MNAAASVVLRTVLLAVLWWALVEGDTSVLTYGLVAVPLTVALSYGLTGPPAPRRPAAGRRLLAGVRLAGWVLVKAFLGGVDVARRAVGPASAVDPVWTTWRTGLDGEVPRVLLVLVSNLLPGTISVSLEGDTLQVHAISPELGVEDSLRELERRLAATLGA